MAIGHSRLLKFLVKDKPKMEKHTLKIEDLAPSLIESEVPRQQKLREDTVEPTVDENKTPPTKVESVKNVGQIEWVDLRDMIKKPVYMGLQEEVIKTQRIRPPRENGPPGHKTETPEVNKPQTRIPVSRFKPAAERVLQERKDASNADESKGKREAPEKPRRTSIPKLKDRITVAKNNSLTEESHVKKESHPIKDVKEKIPVKTNLKRATRNDKITVMSKDHYKITKKNDVVKNEIQNDNKHIHEDTLDINSQDEPTKPESIEKLDDEFEKLYEEIVDSDAASPAGEILETKVKDTEKLETKFEEIVHQYDDPPTEKVKIEPVDKARYSKIPLLRRRSSHDVNVSGPLERRLSLKTGSVNKTTPVSDQKANDNIVKKDHNEMQNTVTEEIVQGSGDTDQDVSAITINNNDQYNKDRYIESQSPDLLPVYNTIATPDSELVKVGILGITTRDIPFEETNQKVATPELETVKVAVLDTLAKKTTNNANETIDFDKTKPDHFPKIQDKNVVIPELETVKVAVKDIPADKTTNYANESIEFSKTKPDHIPKIQVPNVTTPELETVNVAIIDTHADKTANHSNESIKFDKTKPDRLPKTQLPNVASPELETVRVANIDTHADKTANHSNESIKFDKTKPDRLPKTQLPNVATPELETVKVAVTDTPADKTANHSNESIKFDKTKPDRLPKTQLPNVASPELETVRVAIIDTHADKTANHSNESIKFDKTKPDRLPKTQLPNVASPELETVRVAIIDTHADKTANHSNESIKFDKTKPDRLPKTQLPNVAASELETVKVAVTDTPADNTANHVNENIKFDKTNPDHLPKIQDNIYNSSDDNHGVETKPIETKIYKKNEKDTINAAMTNNDPVVRDTNRVAPDQKVRPDNELKSYTLIKNTNNVEERTKSRYINKPPREEAKPKSEENLKEDIPTVKGKVSRILRRLTSQESPNNDFNIDNKETIDKKKELDDIQKKKSVLSKIAMFERRDPEPPLPKKATHAYSKPTRTISEDLKHSPKIVQEVLKPKGEETNIHTIVTVDIAKPVDVITSNEEQVMVVEDLKEETVTYDNFDDARRNKTESDSKTPIIQQVPLPNGVHRDKNTIVSVDISKPIDVSTNNEEQLTIVEQLKETIVTYDNFDNDRLNKPEPNEIEPKISQKYIDDNKAVAIDKSTNNDKLKDRNNYLEPKADYTMKKENQLKEKWKSTDALTEFLPVKEKIHRLKSYEDSNLKKAKSTAELDLGDAVKGKVKKLIVRMNSSELLDDVKPKSVEVISAKERPRKRSVSEKIALFERKLTPIAMDNIKVDTSPRALSSHTKPAIDNVNSIPVKDVSAPVNMTDAAKIKELTNAKLTYGSVSNMSYIALRDGRKMPVLALGTALIEPNLVTHVVTAAIDLGYRAIDTAFIYGNEKEIGEGIRAKIQDGTVRREELFIMNKMWSTFHRPDLVERACRASLAAMGLDYFDLYMIHNPMSFKEGGDPLPKIANVLQFSEYDYLDAWFAMERLVPKGLVRSIGVSNFNSSQLARVLEKGRIKPVVNQVECHPYLSQKNLSEFCDARDVRLSCFGVLGSKGTPAELKASQAAAIDDPLLQVMAAGLGVSPAQLLIRYQLDSGHAAVVKASSAAHLWDALRALGFTLEAPQIAAIHALNKNKRAFTFAGMGDTHKNYPFKIAF